MSFSNIFGTTDILSKALEASWKRNEVYASNIANAETPGYKRKEVVFEEYLEEALKSESPPKKIFNVQPKVIESNSNLSYRLDGNNVNIDTEMSMLAQNQIKYYSLVSQVNYNFERLKMVMKK